MRVVDHRGGWTARVVGAAELAADGEEARLGAASVARVALVAVEGEEEEVTFEKLDYIVTKLVTEFEEKQWFKKKCKTSILFVREGDAEGSYGVLPHKGRLEAHLNYIKGEAEKEKIKQIIYLRDNEVVFEDL